jgi:hypothetical protein
MPIYRVWGFMRHVMTIFGEAEKGKYRVPYFLKDLPQLVELFGNPPAESEGLFFAIQALLFRRDLIYFRVEEEGFSAPDYYIGLKYLEEKSPSVNALCLPGVGDPKILDASQAVCRVHKSFLITSQKDLYDYLTN